MRPRPICVEKRDRTESFLSTCHSPCDRTIRHYFKVLIFSVTAFSSFSWTRFFVRRRKDARTFTTSLVQRTWRILPAPLEKFPFECCVCVFVVELEISWEFLEKKLDFISSRNLCFVFSFLSFWQSTNTKPNTQTSKNTSCEFRNRMHFRSRVGWVGLVQKFWQETCQMGTLV